MRFRSRITSVTVVCAGPVRSGTGPILDRERKANSPPARQSPIAVTHARRLHGIVTSDLTDRTTPRAPRATRATCPYRTRMILFASALSVLNEI